MGGPHVTLRGLQGATKEPHFNGDQDKSKGQKAGPWSRPLSLPEWNAQPSPRTAGQLLCEAALQTITPVPRTRRGLLIKEEMHIYSYIHWAFGKLARTLIHCDGISGKIDGGFPSKKKNYDSDICNLFLHEGKKVLLTVFEHYTKQDIGIPENIPILHLARNSKIG